MLTATSTISTLAATFTLEANDIDLVLAIAERRRRGEETTFAEEERKEQARQSAQRAAERKRGVFIGGAVSGGEAQPALLGPTVAIMLPLTESVSLRPLGTALVGGAATWLSFGTEVCARLGGGSLAGGVCARAELGWMKGSGSREDDPTKRGLRAETGTLAVGASLFLSGELTRNAFLEVRAVPAIVATATANEAFVLRGEVGLAFKE